MLYKSLADVIANIESIFNEDYSQGQAGLDKLGVFNITMRYPQNYKEFGNDVIGEWSQPFTTSTTIENNHLLHFFSQLYFIISITEMTNHTKREEKK